MYFKIFKDKSMLYYYTFYIIYIFSEDIRHKILCEERISYGKYKIRFFTLDGLYYKIIRSHRERERKRMREREKGKEGEFLVKRTKKLSRRQLFQ